MAKFVKGDIVVVPFPFSDFSEGSLPVESNIRPNRLFTADRNIILYKAGRVHQGKIDQVVAKTIDIIRS